MNAQDIILNKRNGIELSPEEIEFLVEGYSGGLIPDYQMAAWLMAVCFQGMTDRETADLTMAMVNSGRTLDLSCIPGVKVDKHSTGGVGDKTTLVLIPILAATGVPVAKMSGRCLSHTGGTIDKLESIPGFSADLTPERMTAQVKEIGEAIACQTGELTPADKKIYALRDVTATVDCIPLIAASIMSKKIAAGADAIVLDVKAGSGAFMKTTDEAAQLAQAMVGTGRQVGRQTIAAITDMDQPLGRAVGNALEVREAIETLNGGGPADLVQLCKTLGGMALILAGKVETLSEGESLIETCISDGSGLYKLRELIETQGGDPRVVDDPSLLPQARLVRPLAPVGRVRCVGRSSEYVARLDALKIAHAALELGAGRGTVGGEIDPAVGVYLHKKIGDFVSDGESLAYIHANDERSADLAAGLVLGAYEFAPEPPVSRELVQEIIGEMANG